jgi:hypothetical protein
MLTAYITDGIEYCDSILRALTKGAAIDGGLQKASNGLTAALSRMRLMNKADRQQDRISLLDSCSASRLSMLITSARLNWRYTNARKNQEALESNYESQLQF